MVGERIVTQNVTTYNDEVWCTKNISSPLYAAYCGNSSAPDESDYCTYFMNEETEVGLHRAIPGLSSGIFLGKA